ncbi:MAG: PAS domain-containing protein [Kofleriaceae bacterium]|nr:PAS domain-containing protein [Kofleriaceae bacterium]
MLDLAAAFEASPNPYMVLDRELRYVAVNKAYLEVTGRTREQLIGHRLLQMFPHDPADPNNEPATQLVRSIERVFATGEPGVLPFIHYRIAIDGEYRDHYWSATHTPLFDTDGTVEFVLQHTVNVTKLREKRITTSPQVAAGVLDRAERVDRMLRELLSVFDQAPGFFAFLRGPDHVFELANRAYYRLVNGREVIGKSVREALPEVGTEYFDLLDRVYATGEPFIGNAMPVVIALDDGGVEHRYVDFIYQPLIAGDGSTVGLIVSGHEVTARIRAEQARTAIEARAHQLSRVLDETRDFVGIANMGSRPTYVNPAGLRLIGIPDLASMPADFVDCFVPAQRAFVRDVVVPTAMREGYWEGELLFRNAQTCEEIPVLYAIFPLRDGRGETAALATISRDLRTQKETERERIELLEAEQAARSQAERSSHLMDQFLATVSHELRTPLTAILGWMQMLRSGMVAPEKRERALEVVERNAHVQAQLVEDLLDVSRIITGKLPMDMEPTDIAGVIGAAVETVRPVAENKGVRLDIFVEGNATVQGDSSRLQQVVWNLLSNAVKFTPKDGLVALRAESRGDFVEISISDTGIGIAKEFLPHVFDRFRQAEEGSTRRLGGLGLGLSIVQHVVTMHGGSVSATSEGPGSGATFTVRLPTMRGHVSANHRVAYTPPAKLSGMRVLVVDDEEDTRSYVRSLLEQCQATVTTADSAAAAYDAIQRERPDVMISDLGMPGEDGYNLIRRVRALPDEHGGRTPAVALTAYARKEDRTRAMLAGFQNHVPKPVEPAELLAVVASLAPR